MSASAGTVNSGAQSAGSEETGMTDMARGGASEGGQGQQPASLDVPQEFDTASSYRVRDELAGLIERDLLGPWDGDLEVFPPRAPVPCERYLVGRLGPRHDPPSSRDAAGRWWTPRYRLAGTRPTGSCRTC
jgi:hypothetical protein